MQLSTSIRDWPGSVRCLNFFNWVEADYKSDEVGKTAALLSMGGGLAIEGAIGSLGMLAGSSLSAGTLTLLTGLSYATLGIGICADYYCNYL